MRHQTPIEVRLATGKRIRNNLTILPEGLRTPALNDLKTFDKVQYRNEVDAFLRAAYDMQGHEMVVAMLAEEMSIYAQACVGRSEASAGVVTDAGEVSAWIKAQNLALKSVIMLIRELGLSPSSRLEATKNKHVVSEEAARFMAGPKFMKMDEESQKG